MTNRNLLKGTFLIIVALAFGLGSLRYSTGDLAHAGPGLFPLVISSLLFLIGVAIVARAFLTDHVPVEFNFKNIAIILGSLVGFALVSQYVNMIAGVLVLVFASSAAGRSYSVVRNLKIAAGMVAVALLFQKGLGLQLPLY